MTVTLKNAIFVYMKRFICITFALSVLFLCSSCGAGRTPKSTINCFFDAIEQGEYDNALSHTSLTAETDYELYYAIMDKERNSILASGGIDKIEVLNEEPSQTNHEYTVITAIIHYGDGSSQEECCEMVKVDNKWKIVADLNAK